MRRLRVLSAAAVTVASLGFAAVYLVSELKLRDREAVRQFDASIPDDTASIERGRHVARTRGCFGCHGQQLQGHNFDEQWDWPKRAVAPNLVRYARANDPRTIAAAVRQGIGADGRELTSMPSYNFARLSDDDLAALIAFLRASEVVEIPLPRPALGWAARWDIARGRELSMADWVRIPAKMTDDSGERDRLAQPSFTGRGFLLGPVTFRQVFGSSAAHGLTAESDAMSAV